MGDLEPILEGLYKLREHSYKASNRAKERLEIATQSLLAVTELLYLLNLSIDNSILEGEVILKLASLCPTVGFVIFKYKSAIYNAKTSEANNFSSQ